MGGTAIYYRPSVIRQIRRDTHCVIEASAGTGKTFAIEHLVIDLLLSGGYTVDQILVVTFTEKATAELRLRVRHALEDILIPAPNPNPAGDTEPIEIDETGRKRIEDAFYGFDRAPISTIHGFCHRVLTDFAFPSGTLLDLQLTDSRGAFHRAFRAELRENLAVKVVTRELLERWLTGSEPEHPKGKTPHDLEKLLFEAYRRRYLDYPDSGARGKAAQHLMDTYDGRLLQQACERSGLNGTALSDALDVIKNLSGRIAQASGSKDRLLDLLAEVEFKPLVGPILRPGKRQAGLRFPPRARELAHDLDGADTAAKSWEWKLVDLFLPPIARRLQRDKREQGLIDYDDMLKWVCDAFEGPSAAALAAALRDRFRVALVDEFQDTDDLQWQIFRTLFVEGSGNRLYVVGDPKQAIYAFRGADVFTYLTARRELTGGRAAVQLVDNFRSTSDLLSACNHIFDQKAGDALFEEGEIRYEHPVRCGRPDRKAADPRGNPITPAILMRYQKAGEKVSVSEVRAAIGRHLAEQLRRILKEDAHRVRIQEKDTDRLVSAKNIFVLTRTRQESAEIGGYLREAGVPFAFYKQEGLFQTSEAGYVLDVLRAVAEPHIRSHRLKAWLSPFFEVPLRELALIHDVAPTHPLNERLYEWKVIADRGRFAELFERLLHNSGLAARELFLAGTERQLINYQHIFELLLTAALARRLDLPEIVGLLEDYIFERALPEVEEPNVQRLESEPEAVSVITVHMSKGLEADVVALFGGFGRIHDQSGVAVYHDDGGERRFAIGKAAKESVNERLKQEQGGEDRRLLYVALTRARARLYLPLVPEDSTKQALGGYYSALNHRLLAMQADPGHRALSKLFAVQDVAEPMEAGADDKNLSRRLAAWAPPPELLDDSKDAASEGSFWNLRRGHYPLVVRSYTSLRGLEQEQRWDIPPEEFKRDLEMPADERDLPGGREVGIFLHEVIERVAMESFAQTPNLDGWRQRDDVKGLFYAAMRRNQVKNQTAWFERGTQAVFHTLTSRIATFGDLSVGPLHQCPAVREMEFVYPIPESSHPLLAAAGAAQGEWTVERGYLKGFVDFVFKDDGLVYFADWKSDQLSSYEAAEIEGHVRNHYRMQARIYSIGIIRLLQIRTEDDYERRFGGLLYIFLRGMDGGGQRGVYFHRPAWSEICAYEAALMRMEAGPAA